MYNKDMYALGSKRSVIRELFEYGKTRAKEQGKDSVFDFSLGNPNVPSPDCVNEAVLRLTSQKEDIHAYTSAQGDESVRAAVAKNLRDRFCVDVSADNIYMTCGAAASLCITLRALNEECDEFIVIAPYFPEYKVFITSVGAKPVVINSKADDLQIDIDSLDKAITQKTKAVIINSPNNPSGVIYTKETISSLAELLKRKSEQFAHPIFIISDEPYRELAYGVDVPFIMNYYDNSIVCYSYSKCLSLPGERIGYIAVNPKAQNAKDLYLAICGGGRALGYVCAPSTFQQVVKECANALPDVSAYMRNRDLIYDALTSIGYECVRPDGAFYLFVKALENDANAFADNAKKLGLLLVPSNDFGINGYVRIAYCVSYDMIKRSLPMFEKLFDLYKSNLKLPLSSLFLECARNRL